MANTENGGYVNRAFDSTNNVSENLNHTYDVLANDPHPITAANNVARGKIDDQPKNERGNWGSSLEFILSMVGYAVGLGNVWRFPYKCYKNGGGAYLIPYFTAMLFLGMPAFFVEIALGQFSGSGPLACWRLKPVFKGIGIGMLVTSWFVSMYYTVIVAYGGYFLARSMTSNLPWVKCDPTWPNCIDRVENGGAVGGNITSNSSNLTVVTTTAAIVPNTTNKSLTPSESFWTYEVLQQSDSIDQLGQVRWQLLIPLLCAWVIVFLVLSKGVKSLGKIVYVTSTVPYVLLTALLIRMVTLPGDGPRKGVEFYLTPKWELLADPLTWADAATQIFFSLSLSGGGLITLASYNKFHNNILRDAIIVPVINCLTSFYAGFVIFSTLGYMAERFGIDDIEKVTSAGPGLAFITYPQAISVMPTAVILFQFPPVWAVLFFIMIIMLGLSSLFPMTEAIVVALTEEFGWLRKFKYSRQLTMLTVIIFNCCISITMITEGGYYVLTIFDEYLGGFPRLVSALTEIAAIMYFYGFYRFKEDIYLMIGRKPMKYMLNWDVCWVLITPLGIVAIMVSSVWFWRWPTVDNYKLAQPATLPEWGHALGLALVAICALPIPCYALYSFGAEGCIRGCVRSVKRSCTSADDWGPADQQDRIGTRYERHAEHFFDKSPAVRHALQVASSERPARVSTHSYAFEQVTNFNGNENQGYQGDGEDEREAIESLEQAAAVGAGVYDVPSPKPRLSKHLEAPPPPLQQQQQQNAAEPVEPVYTAPSALAVPTPQQQPEIHGRSRSSGRQQSGGVVRDMVRQTEAAPPTAVAAGRDQELTVHKRIQQGQVQSLLQRYSDVPEAASVNPQPLHSPRISYRTSLPRREPEPDYDTGGAGPTLGLSPLQQQSSGNRLAANYGY